MREKKKKLLNMNFKVIYLFFVCWVCLVSALPHHQDGHDTSASEGLDMEAKFSPDTQGGHQATNNHFSTSKMDDELSDRLSTVTDSHEETTITTGESLSSIGDDHHEISVLPEVPTTHKLDAKKDPKKKVKPLLKKKDKTFEFEESPDTSSFHTVDETTTNRIIDTTTTTSINLDTTTRVDTTLHNLDTTATTTNAPDMTTVEETTFTVRSDVLHNSMDMESTTMAHADVETAPTESSVPTTTKNENLLSSDEQPPQTTIHENSMETTTTTKTTPFPSEAQETEIQTTTQSPTTAIPETESPEISNGLSIMKNEEEDIPSSDAHFHTEDELTKPEEVPTVTTVVPTTPEDNSKSDNNNMSNDLQDAKTTTASMSVNDDSGAEVTTARKQKQMNLEGGSGCPCNERGTSLDPSECVGGRTAADPNCPCREVCARQSGQSCSPGEPCDEEFGLHCNPQNNTCTGRCYHYYFLKISLRDILICN